MTDCPPLYLVLTASANYSIHLHTICRAGACSCCTGYIVNNWFIYCYIIIISKKELRTAVILSELYLYHHHIGEFSLLSTKIGIQIIKTTFIIKCELYLCTCTTIYMLHGTNRLLSLKAGALIVQAIENKKIIT